MKTFKLLAFFLLGVIMFYSSSCKKETVEPIIKTVHDTITKLPTHDTVWVGKVNPIGSWNCYKVQYIANGIIQPITIVTWSIVFATSQFQENRMGGFVNYDAVYNSDKTYLKIKNLTQSWESCYLETVNAELKMTRVVDSLSNNKIIYYLRK